MVSTGISYVSYCVLVELRETLALFLISTVQSTGYCRLRRNGGRSAGGGSDLTC
jgi:hypothetical protein